MSIESVDVVMLTKNSERVLEKCLNSIYKNIPVNRLIIVDGYSTDSTLKIVKKFREKYGNVILLMDGGTRGSARMKGIREVKTEWFVFVDSDIVLCDEWFEKAKSLISNDVGAVWGIEIWEGIRNPIVLKLFLKITWKIFNLRGGTHDLLVRRETVKDIKIPGNLHVFEDAFIKEWIEKKGYRLVAAYDPYCIHYRPPEAWTIKGSIQIFIEHLRFGSLKKLSKLFVAYAFYTVYVLYRSLLK
ncbi:glycosyltransferase [Candidatus Bathyarchaeota archaeon]|nr:glycosyltransferase [Candidatus Bathyarchaeota archaeon]